jgi:hypothetical protein
MNKLNRLFLLLLICFVLPFNSLRAQSLDSLRRQFPDEKAVMLNNSIEYSISLKEGKPYVESNELQQTEYLLGSATTYLSEYGFSHSDFQQLISYDAYTKESFVFYDDVKETTFNFPAVEPGAVGNLEVSYLNKDPHLLGSFYFTGRMPIVNSELKITVSKDISLKYVMMGLDTANVSVNVESKHHNNIYTFQYKNCPAEKSYGDAPGYAWYSPHVIFYIENYRDDKGSVVPYLSNEDDLYRLSYGYLKDVNTKIDPALKHIVDSLTVNTTSLESKARAIYSWVQGNIKYVAFEDGMGGFVPRDAGLVCSRRFGDCKDMASILTEMLTAADVPAYFTWLGTRDMPYKFSQTPLPLVSNHMICTILLNGKYIFLDATDPTCVFGMPSAGIQDKEAMISINEKEYKILKVPVVEKERNMVVDTTWLELTPDGLKGKIKKTLKGYFAMEMHGKLMYWRNKDMNEDMQGEFERGSNKFKLDTFYIDKKQTADEISLYAGFSLPDYAKSLDNYYYLNLNLFKFFMNERIDYPQRKIPVGNDFNYVKKYVTMLKIPDGYKLTYLPPGKAYHNNVWGFDMQYEQKGNWVILTQQFDNNNLMLTSNQFAEWNKVLQNLFPLYKETLSLSKN